MHQIKSLHNYPKRAAIKFIQEHVSLYSLVGKKERKLKLSRA